MTRPTRRFPRPTAMAHLLVSDVVREGDTVVDATIGNGHDTLFLKRLVGSSGEVIGFDIQDQAIAQTRDRLGENNAVHLHLDSHENMSSYLDGEVNAVMFNLGYLPGGDQTVITIPESTLAALKAASEHLAINGVITIVAYIGHEGGSDEALKVDQWAEALCPDHFSVIRYEFSNRKNKAPYLIGIQRLA
ncbi:methyltransferase domain-containing protein [Verrucomicrobiales bacterium]|nr:methyltransferase domain-containing protein [Verrucomicrobiales bacterium]